MRFSLYPKLALTGIKKNKKLYFPYIFSGILISAIFYIVSYLKFSDTVSALPGGEQIQTMLDVGKYVIGVFALIFLFYTNSFLIKQRYKEIGLYNILGMDKKHISYIMIFEGIAVALISVFGGLFFGIALSKLSEYGLVKMMSESADFSMNIEPMSIVETVITFAIIYVLITAVSLIRVARTDAIALFHSSKKGEKPPKANFFLALAGALLLAGAYVISVSAKDPLEAINGFMIAVIMVIVATYILFVTGSVWLCKFLQKRKAYYYKANHFVSVSSMAYRMKRNGAGLASICILSTMVLVTLSSTFSLYINEEDMLNNQYPHDFTATMYFDDILLNEDELKLLRSTARSSVEKSGAAVDSFTDYCYLTAFGMLSDGNVIFKQTDEISDDKRCVCTFVSIDDYNEITDSKASVNSDEVLIHTERCSVDGTIKLGDKTFRVKKAPAEIDVGISYSLNIPMVYIAVADMDEAVKILLSVNNKQDEFGMKAGWSCDIDVTASEDVQIKAAKIMRDNLLKVREDYFDDKASGLYCDGKAATKGDFYGVYGGLFFLGIVFSLIFLTAAVMIIYYKQLSEGLEDQSRFEIMQKIGMTKKDIRKSINSQVLTVFFSPLILAGVHIGFAFPAVWKVMQAFNLQNMPLFIGATVCCFVIFSIIYLIVYRLTAKTYYSIVSSDDKNS